MAEADAEIKSAIDEAEDGLFNPQLGLKLMDGNQAIFHSLLSQFIAIYADLPGQIRQLVQADNQKGMVRICHNLKSTTGHAGSVTLSSRSSLIEKSIKASAWPLEKELLQELEQYVADVVTLQSQIKTYLATVHQTEDQANQAGHQAGRKAPGHPAKNGDQRTMTAELQTLRQHLSEHDPVSSRLVLQQLLQSDHPDFIKTKLFSVGTMLNQYQFENALALIDQLF